MLYKELIQYEAIESLVQLRDASDRDKAKKLVGSYVISNEMSDRICSLIIPQLQFDIPADNKGLLVVGNYGTGKSHLLSVVSSICGDESLVEYLTDDKVKEAAKAIAGRFKVVIRTELGATTMPLRDIIISELEEHLKNNGISYTFPTPKQTYSHKRAFEDMMLAFHEKYPDQGLILVVDELLDYLKSRKDQELILDLSFMREIGEVCKDLRFRFIAGVQEAIFDSHKFMFVADSMRRVKDRFEQVRIARNDLKYVVAHRLLKKTADQINKVREYLTPFSQYFEGMNERMDEFLDLFPIHPNYIDTFESITLIEKREVLKTISLNIKQIIENEVPSDRPGIIAYDSYWAILSDNPSYRTIPDVKEVIDCNKVLITRVEQSFTRPIYVSMAIRIVNGLSLHRLTMGDTHVPIGATPQELKNNLVLFDSNAASMGGDEPDKDLTTLVETVLREIHKTVSGQFISVNPDNGQYYLDLKKTDDYDAIIEKRADTLSDDKLDSYYFEVLKRVLERMDATPYVSGYKIWQYEINWKEKNSPRSGYLFFGSPNERSTAVPQRDYYIYFMQTFSPFSFDDQKLPDEVFLYLNKRDAEFDTLLKNYAAAHDLSLSASGQAKNVYLAKSEQYIRKIVTWLQNNIWESFDVIYQGKKQTLNNWAKGKPIREISGIKDNETANFRDIVNAVSSICLAQHFEEQAPKYPRFSVLITGYNRNQAVVDTLRSISNQSKTKQSIAILEALNLLDSDKLSTENSDLAKYIMLKLQAKGHGQVLNRGEIISDELGVDYLDPHGFRLEPEWVVIVLAAMVYCGDIILSVPGNKFDATNFQYLAATDLDSLINFKHIEMPKDWNVPALKALFELLELNPGLVQMITQGNEEPVKQMQETTQKMIDRIIIIQRFLTEGLVFWGIDMVKNYSLEKSELQLTKTKEFLEAVKAFNTAPKLKNFKYSVTEIEEHKTSIIILKTVNAIRDFITNLNTLVTWLSSAEVLISKDHPWLVEFHNEKEKILDLVKTAKPAEIKSLVSKISVILQDLKKRYITNYIQMHSKIRLNKQDDAKKAALTNDIRIRNLLKLGEIEIMPKQQVNDFLTKLSELKSCFNLTEQNLQTEPICPHCRFNPAVEPITFSASNLLNQLDTLLDTITVTWTAMLIKNLKDKHTQESIDLLNEKDKSLIQNLISSKQLPDQVDDHLVQILQQVLAGLSKVTFNLDDLCRAITKAGGSISPDELRKVLENYVDDLVKGKKADRVRIILE